MLATGLADRMVASHEDSAASARAGLRFSTITLSVYIFCFYTECDRHFHFFDFAILPASCSCSSNRLYSQKSKCWPHDEIQNFRPAPAGSRKTKSHHRTCDDAAEQNVAPFRYAVFCPKQRHAGGGKMIPKTKFGVLIPAAAEDPAEEHPWTRTSPCCPLVPEVEENPPRRTTISTRTTPNYCMLVRHLRREIPTSTRTLAQ